MFAIRFVSVAAVAFAAVAPSTLAAQAAAPLTAGTRARVQLRTAPPKTLVGTVDAFSGDTLSLRIRRNAAAQTPVFDIVSVPLSVIGTLEVSRGHHAHTGKGALIGLGAGAVLGAAAGSGGGCGDGGVSIDRGSCAAIGGVGGALMGAGLGAIIGALSATEEWVTVPLSSVRMAPVGATR